MQSINNHKVADAFNAYPCAIRDKLMLLREQIYHTAAHTKGVGALEETLKWGEPAYLTTQSHSGSMIRIAWKKSTPHHYGMYFLCQTTLVDGFRRLFPNEFTFGGNRSIMFSDTDIVPIDALRCCIAMALTYRLDKPCKQGRWPEDAP